MGNFEKSIRHELKYFGPKLRSGHWGALYHTYGAVPNDFRYLSLACCDIENGIVTDIRLYGVGDATTKRDYDGESIDITRPIDDYLRGKGDWKWDNLIEDIKDTILSAMHENEV